MSTQSGPGYTIEAGPSAYPPKWVPTARPRSSRARSPPLAHSPGTPPRPPAHLKGDFRRQANLSGSKKSFSRIRGNSGFSPVKSILLCLAYLCVIYLIWYVRERTDEIWEMRLGDGIERSGESDMEIRGGESMLNLTGDVGGDEEGGVVEEVKGLEEDEGGGQVIEDEDIAVVGKRRGGGRRKYAPENVRMNAGEEEEEEQEDDERSEAERQKFCDGKEKVVKNALIDDKVTVLLSSSAATWQPQLAKLAQRLSKLPFVHSVQVVLEGWEGKKGRENKFGDYKRHLFSGPNVSVIRSSTGDPNLRFVPRKPVNTTAVLWCLDDLIVDPELLAFSFDVWRANRGTLVGTSPRSHVYENETGTWRYVTDTLPFGAGQFSIIVGSALIFSSNLLYDYACNMPSGVWDFVDEVGDCGDLALNFLAANKSGQAPVLVGGRKAPVHEGGRRSVLSSQMPRETFKKDIAPFVFSKEDVRLSRQLLEINSTNSNVTDREPAGGGWLSFFGWGARKQRENLPLSNLSRKKKGSFLPKRGLSVQKKKQTSELKNMTKNEIQKPPPQMKKARRRRIEEDATLRSQCLNKLIELWGGMPLKWNVGQLSPRETKKPMCERDGELIPCEDNPSGIVTVSRKKGNLNKIVPSPPAQRFAFIFLVFSPELLKIAVVAAQSLRLTGTPHEIVLLAGGNANLNNLDAEHLFLIDQHFTSMRPVSTIRNPHTHNAYSKLHAWSLTEYTRVVYLDIDILILENIDELFNHPGLAAVPDVYESTKFNSGVMVIEPSLATYSKMVSLAGSRTSYNRDDQGFLNPFFESWYSMDIEHRLPFKYNAIIHFPKTYIPPAGLYVNRAHEFLGPLAIIHFANPWFKPWKNRKNSTCSVWCKAWLRVREELAKNEWRKLDPEKFQVLDGIPSPWLDLKNPFAVRRHVREEALKARFQKKKEEVEKREEAEKRKREEALEAQFRKREEVEEREVMGEESMEGENGVGFQENVKMEEEGMSKRGKYGINEKTRDSDETGETGEYRENGTGDNGEKGKSWETREGEEWANVVGNRRRILTASDSLYSSEKLGLFGENSFGIEAEWNKTLNSIDKSQVKEETKKDVQVQVEQEGEGEFEKEREEEEDEDEGGEEGGIKKQVWIWERERLPPPIEERMINPHVRQGYSDDAFATLLTREDEAFLLGTWGLSYRQHHRLGKGGSSMRPTLLLVLSTVPEQAWMPYKALFADILVVEPLGIETERRRFAPEFSLLYLWNQVKYERIVFVDALSLFWDNCNGILDWEPFAAVPSALPGDRFNPRTLLLQPDERTFQDMLGKLTSPLYPTDSLENFLNAYFHTWYSSPAPHRMPLSYAVDTMLKPHSMKYVYPWKIISFDPRTPPFSDLSRWKGQPRMFAATKWRMVFCRLRTKLRPNHLRHLCEQKP